MSESEKRKQDGLNDDVRDAERKAREDDGGQAAGVTNVEVDEFFAILRGYTWQSNTLKRRMKTAVS